jgi:nucleotide-binding universal stress UspA family protein
LRERAESVVESVAERAADAGVETVTAVEPGVPDDVVVEYAADHDCDLVVMGTHGRTGLQRYLLGSVTERTVRRSSVPVLTVRGTDD